MYILSVNSNIWFRWHSFLGVYDVAIKHMLEVLACAHQPLPTQQLFLSEFLHTVQVDTTFVFVYFSGSMFEIHFNHFCIFWTLTILMGKSEHGENIRGAWTSAARYRHAFTESYIWRSSDLCIIYCCKLVNFYFYFLIITLCFDQ